MSGNAVHRWPRTAAGTTDWELVFEADQSGLIAVIGEASTIDSLSECALVVVRSLFTRKNDRPEIARFTALLTAAIADGHATNDMETTKDEVVRILRQIKDQRIELAEKYLAQKNQRRAIERRRKSASSTPKPASTPFGANRAVLGAVACVVLVIGIAGWALIGSEDQAGDVAAHDKVTATPQKPAKPEARKARQKQREATRQANVAPPPEETASAYPRAVLLKPFYWSYGSKSGGQRYISYQPFLEVPAKDQYSTICVNVPWVTDAIYLALSRIHPRDRLASSAELGRIAGQSAKQINGRYGAGTVGGVTLVPNSDKRFRHAVTRCELQKSKDG